MQHCAVHVVISCEAGGTKVPSQITSIFGDSGDGPVPDVAAAYLAGRLARRIGATLILNDHALSLVDVTRSLHHRYLFPKATRRSSEEDRRQLIDTIYLPYRQELRSAIKRRLDHGTQVIHLSLRTFAAKRAEKFVRTDMGLLYDPAFDSEVGLCLDWIDEMYDLLPMLRVRRNYPRRGTIDSINKAMRQEFLGRDYIGVELMMNRAWAGRSVAVRDQVIDGIGDSLKAVFEYVRSQAA